MHFWISKITSSLYLIIFISTIFTHNGASQVAVLSSGGDGQSERGSVSFSVGQVADEHQSSKVGDVNEGVQQPFEIYNTIIGTEIVEGYKFLVSPNPFHDWIVVQSTNVTSDHIDYCLVDLSGRIYSKGIITQPSQTLSLPELQPSMYIIMLTNRTQLVSSFKIVKTE